MIIAIEIGGTKLQIALADPAKKEIVQVSRFVVDKAGGAEGILKTILTVVHQFLSITPQVEAIVVGFGGPVNAETGEVAISHQIAGWGGFQLKEWMYSQFGLPVFIENDANVAALGEAVYGAGKNESPVLYLTLGSGVGGGLIVNGELYKGNLPGELEIGHLNLDAHGKTFESVCSGWALDTIIRNAVTRASTISPLVELTGNSTAHEAKFLYAAIEQNDPLAISIFNDYIDNLCWGLSHAVHLLNPKMIILGGGVSLIGEPLKLAVKQRLPMLLAKVLLPGPEIELAETGENVVLLGALVLYQSKQQKNQHKFVL
jgi:glucokinase